MAQRTSQIQTQTQKQIQTLSPQQILVVKLLELPTLEFEDRIHAELLENPALERNDEQSIEEHTSQEEEAEYDVLDDYLTEDDVPDYKLRDNNYSPSDRAEDIPFADTTSFFDLLQNQLREQNLTTHEREIAAYLIGSLDDDGILRKSLDSIYDELAIYAGIETNLEELEHLLQVIQRFDPPGIGARDLQECLLLQIRRKNSKHYQLEKRILENHYEEFTKKHWDKIAQKLNVDQQTLTLAIDEITKLNPRPGASLGETIGKNMQQIIPDFLVETFDNTITLTLNSKNVPDLKISNSFSTLIQEHAKNRENQSDSSKEALIFVKQKIDSAQNFINAIRQRQQTLLSTMQAIIDIQHEFFLTGDESKLRPMILKDVAEKTDLDISTISRVSNSKYVQTNFGVFSLKFFFNDSFTTEDGEEMSIREVKLALLDILNKEDKSSPYTDEQLSKLLDKKGYPIARRTVAKYRQQLKIPVARLRR